MGQVGQLPVLPPEAHGQHVAAADPLARRRRLRRPRPPAPEQHPEWAVLPVFVVGNFLSLRGRHPSPLLLRELVGNPFDPAEVDPTWLAWKGGMVLELAQDIYDQRAFNGLLVLADALEDAGCADARLLEHLRAPAGHYLGCWALDAILCRE